LQNYEQTVHEGLKQIDRSAMETLLVEKIKTGGATDVMEVRCRHCAAGWAVLRQSRPRRATPLPCATAWTLRARSTVATGPNASASARRWTRSWGWRPS